MSLNVDSLIERLPRDASDRPLPAGLLHAVKGDWENALVQLEPALAPGPADDCRSAVVGAVVAGAASAAAHRLENGATVDALRLLAKIRPAAAYACAEDAASLNRSAAAAVARGLDQGVDAHRNGRFHDAMATYAAVLAVDPSSYNARHMLALAYKHVGNVATALRELGALACVSPYDHNLHHNLSNTIGLALKQAGESGDPVAAERLYEAAAAAGALKELNDPLNPMTRRGYDVPPTAPARVRAELTYANIHGHILPDDFLAYLTPDANVFECGGADGEDSAILARLFHRGTVFTVEASTREFEILSRRIAGIPNIRAFNMLISDKTEERTFYLFNADIGRNTLALPPGSLSKDFTPVSIPAAPIDAWAAERGVDRLDLFWLDMEGYELKALQGAENMLRTAKVVYAEVSDVRQHDQPEACRFDELRDWLARRGFVVERELRPWVNGGGNVLFVRKEISQRR